MKQIVGRMSGKLTITKMYGLDKDRRLLVLCKCECGNEIILPVIQITSKLKKSCGCLKRGMKKVNLERDRKIIERHSNGERISNISRDLGVSRQRIFQIVRGLTK